MLPLVLLLYAVPLAALGGISMAIAHRERRRRELRCCPVCHARDIVRAMPRPPRDAPHYRRVATAYRCTACGRELFELARPHTVGPLTGEQLDSWLSAHTLPVATLRRG